MGEKVVVHFRDGRLLKGFASHPEGNVSNLDVLPLDQRDHPVTVRLESVKAIFFVKDFAGDSAYTESKAFGDDEPYRPGRVAFHMEDGEVLAGRGRRLPTRFGGLLPDARGLALEQRPLLRRRGGDHAGVDGVGAGRALP